MTPDTTPTPDNTPGAAQSEEAPGCRHRWVIESPNGPTCSGRCKRCGAGRTFLSYALEYDWHVEPSFERRRWAPAHPPRPLSEDDDPSPAIADRPDKVA